MKNKNILKVVLATILVVTLCTWIFPSASFQTVLMEGERVQVGLFDLFAYPMVALTYFVYVILYVLAVGIFYGVANKIPAYHALIEKIVKSFKDKEYIFLSVVMVLIAVLVSITGLSFGMIFVFPLIIAIVLKMGYNKLVATSVTVGSTIAGIAGTTLGVSTVTYMTQVLGIDIMDEMVSKVIILVIFTIVLVANVLLYAKKTKDPTIKAEAITTKEEPKVVKKEEVKTVKKETVKKAPVKKETVKKAPVKKETTTKKETTKKETSTKKTSTKTTKAPTKTTKSTKTKAAMAKNDSEVIKVNNKKDKKDKKVRIWPFILIFDLMLIILGMSIVDWSGLFDITWFTDATKAVLEYKVLGFPIFGKILGTVGEFGEWTLNIELPAFIMIATLILALVYRVKLNDLLDGIKEGFMKAIKPATLMMLTYVVLIIVTYHPFQLVITKFLLDLTSGLNVVTMSIAAIFASLFNIETTYVAQSTIPYVMSVITDSSLYPLLGIIFQSIYGLMMLVAPTSIILIGTLSYLEVPYGQWLKHIWKVFLELLAILVIIFLIILAI